MQHRILKTISTIECRDINPLLGHIIRTWLICAVDTISSQTNVCHASDLGSALVDENNTLYGLSTSNEETCNKATLNIYTNIFAQLEWIRLITTGWPW